MDEIYKEYSKSVYVYLLSLTKNENIAEDLLQETFYSAVKNINKFRKESSMKTWLYSIARNKWIDYCKKNRKLKEIDELNEKDIISNRILEEEIINKNNLIDILKKLHNMNEKSKEIFYLRIFTNFSFKEIADIVGKTEENTRTIFFRVKNKLKEEFRNE